MLTCLLPVFPQLEWQLPQKGFLSYSLLCPLCQKQCLAHAGCSINVCRVDECALCPPSDHSLSPSILRTCHGVANCHPLPRSWSPLKPEPRDGGKECQPRRQVHWLESQHPHPLFPGKHLKFSNPTTTQNHSGDSRKWGRGFLGADISWGRGPPHPASPF